MDKSFITSVAKKADFPPEFISELEAYLDFAFADGEIKRALEEYYNLLFKGEKDTFPISLVDDIPIPEASEEKFPGFFSSVIFFAAAEHFEDYITENGLENCKYDLSATYYKNLRRFAQMNFDQKSSYAFIKHGRYLYGYSKPYILHVGRLSYELMEEKEAPCEVYENEEGERMLLLKGEAPKEGFEKLLKEGDYYITIHIPGNDKLTREAVEESIAEALPIIRKTFGKYNPKCFLCDSWLLSPQLLSFLKEDSNIRAFQSIFQIIKGGLCEGSLFEHIFCVPYCPVTELKPRNSFQKSILSLYDKGERLHAGYGLLKKEYSELI